MAINEKLHIVAPNGYIERDGKYLILKRSAREIQNPSQWTTPGGKVEKGDTISETVKKEVLEECGLEVKGALEYVGDQEFTRVDGIHVVVPMFKCQVKDGEVKIDENDFDDFAWAGLEDLGNYEIIPGIRSKLEELLKNE